MKTNEITGAELCRGRHGDAPGVRSPRKRRAGARRGSAPLAVLLALVMALAFPARASADGVLPSSGWQPFTFYTQNRGADGTFYCVTNSASDFNTALHLIGRMSDYLQLSNEQLAKLSNEGSGGRFYQLAKSFESAAGWNEDTNLPHEWSVAMGAVDAAGILYGHSYTWWGTVTDELLQGAKTDYMVIYNGGSLGGGGGSGSWTVTLDSKPVKMPGSGYASGCSFVYNGSTVYTNDVYRDNTFTELLYSRNAPNTLTFVPSAAVDTYVTNMQNQGYSLYITNYNFGGGTSPSFDIYLISGEPTVTTTTTSYSGTSYDVDTYSWPSGTRYYVNNNNGYSWNPDGTLNMNSNSWNSRTGAITLKQPRAAYNYYYNFGTGGGSGGGGGGGDNNWPGPTDEPEPGPPEPPREPDPIPRDPIDWPQPYNPTTPAPGPEPTPTTPVTNPTNTSPADYTPWLMAILSELRGIHTDVNAWLDAIFEGIVDYGAAICSHIDSASENVRSTLRFMTQWMDEQLDSSFYQLRHLLWECANYIADSLDYTFVGPDVNVPGYDDSSVLYWLKRIYFKLGSGNVNTRPVDPVADHDNWWDWIVQLIKNFILDLGMMGSDFLSDMGDVLSEVVQKFPFSIPWDIAAYLTAFSTQPVTPVIVITIPAMSGFLPQIQWTIDLHPYDDAMATVRACETIVFAFWLMWKCPILLDMMDTAKWGI